MHFINRLVYIPVVFIFILCFSDLYYRFFITLHRFRKLLQVLISSYMFRHCIVIKLFFKPCYRITQQLQYQT